MGKRGAKLTRAEKILLSEEQRHAAGIDLSKPSNYALKIALDNGVEDTRLGTQFKENSAHAFSPTSTIGQSTKSLKPRFSQADVIHHRHRIEQHLNNQQRGELASEPIRTKLTKRNTFPDKMKPPSFDQKSGRLVIEPYGWYNSKLINLTTLSYKGVAHFDNIMNKEIQLPEPGIPITSDSVTYFSANQVNSYFTSRRETEAFFDSRPHIKRTNRRIVIQEWAIARTIISNPNDPSSPAETEVIYHSDEYSPLQIFCALRGWSNGSDNISTHMPIDAGQEAGSALVVSRSAWDYFIKKGSFATCWPDYEIEEENGLKTDAPEAAYNDLS